MKRIRTQNWLTIAVAKRMVVMCALVLGMTACSNEDNIPGEIPGRTNIIDLSGVVSDLTITNGMTLTGKLTKFHNIRIAAGATVTLSGVRIPGRDITDDDQLWTHAGITCLGDATIVLADSSTNYVKGFGSSYPGIQAGPKGTMLTICGSGKLMAETGMENNVGYAAGIGGGQNQTVGNITIKDCTVAATAGFGAAGIGSGYAYQDGTASCGNISIINATIIAHGGEGAACIGSGWNNGNKNSCGDIYIYNSTFLDASDPTNFNNIGAGNGSTMGDITISDDDTKIAYTCYFTFSPLFTMWPEGSQQPSFDISSPRASTITISNPHFNQSVTVNPSLGSYFTNDSESETFSLTVANGDELTFTATDVTYGWQSMEEHSTFVGTCIVREASKHATINLNSVILRKQ